MRSRSPRLGFESTAVLYSKPSKEGHSLVQVDPAMHPIEIEQCIELKSSSICENRENASELIESGMKNSHLEVNGIVSSPGLTKVVSGRFLNS